MDGEEGLFEEDDPLALFVLRLVKDGLHFLHVAWSVAVHLLQDLLVAATNLRNIPYVRIRMPFLMDLNTSTSRRQGATCAYIRYNIKVLSVTFSASCWTSALSSWIFFCLSMEMSGFP